MLGLAVTGLILWQQGYSCCWDEFGTAFEVSNCSICRHWITSSDEAVAFSAGYNGCHVLKKDGVHILKVRLEELTRNRVAAARDINIICPKPQEHVPVPESNMHQPGPVKLPQPNQVHSPEFQPGLVHSLHPSQGSPGVPQLQPGQVRPGMSQLGEEYPEVSQPDLGLPPSRGVHSGGSQPGLGHPQQPIVGRPGTSQPGLVHPLQPGKLHPELSQPGQVRPGSSQTGLIHLLHPIVVNPGVSQPSLVQLLQPGQVHPGVSQLGEVRPGMSQPGQVRPGMSQPGEVHPVVSQPGQVPPGVSQPGEVPPGMSQPGQVPPGMSQPGQVPPGMSQPGQVPPGISQPGQIGLGIYQPGQMRPGMSQPSQVRPGVSQPGQVHPGMSQPSQVRPGMSQPSQVRPVVSQPDQMGLGIYQPGQMRPGMSQPGQVHPVVSQPEQMGLGIYQPGQVRPGMSQPGQVRPGQVRPGMSQPGQVRPGLSQPGQVNPLWPSEVLPGLPQLPSSQVHPWLPFPGPVHSEVLVPSIGLARTQQQCQVSSGRIPCTDVQGPTACLQTGCCYDASDHVTPCYYGNTVTVQCLQDGHFILAVSRDMLDYPIILDSVKLAYAQADCNPIRKTESFLVFHFPLTQCGTTVQVTGGKLIYENQLVSGIDILSGPDGFITRDSTFTLHARCIYNATDFLPLQVEVFSPPSPAPIFQVGPLRLELRIATDSSYTSYYSDTEYPIVKILREPLHVEIRILQRMDPSLVLVLHECWATPSTHPFEQLQWPILVDGCPFEGDNYRTELVPMGLATAELPFPNHYQRFIVYTFTFVDSAPQAVLDGLVYLFCSVSVCHPSLQDSCRTECQMPVASRGRRFSETENEKESLDLVSTYGAVIFQESIQEKKVMWESDMTSSDDLTLVLLVVLPVIGIILFVAVLVLWKKKSRMAKF